MTWEDYPGKETNNKRYCICNGFERKYSQSALIIRIQIMICREALESFTEYIYPACGVLSSKHKKILKQEKVMLSPLEWK